MNTPPSDVTIVYYPEAAEMSGGGGGGQSSRAAEIAELKAKLKIAVEALDLIECGDDNGDKDIAEIALDKIRGEE